MRFRLAVKLSLFRDKSINCRLKVGTLTSTGIIASVSYVRLYGVSWVEDWGVHLYAQSTSSNSSGHLPFTTPSLFFSSLKMTLLAASAYPFVWGCSTELVTCQIPSPS